MRNRGRLQEAFWRWFIQHERQLFDFKADRERIFDELAKELRKVDPNLCFEFGPKENKREFVISAGGIKGSFPAVISLVTSAPNLDRWRIIAFRPRRLPNVVELGGHRVDPDHVEFSLVHNGRMPGIYLFLPDYREDDANLKQIGYLLLDEAIGEYDVEARVGLIKMLPKDVPTEGERYPLADLPRQFDELISQLRGRSEKPS